MKKEKAVNSPFQGPLDTLNIFPEHYYQEIKTFFFQFSIPDLHTGILDYKQLPVLLEINTFVVQSHQRILNHWRVLFVHTQPTWV